MFQCNQCDLEFVFLYQLMMHRNVHKIIPPLSISAEEREQEMKFFCDRCSSGFPSHSLYVQHIAKHAEIDNKCSLCTKVFVSTKNLENHLRLHTREYYCAKCQKIFNTKKKLQAHRRSDHESKKSYECIYCTKKYTRKEDLQTHIRTHTSELQHSCQYCDQKFWKTSHLKDHYNIHKINNVSGECACAVCGEYFGADLLKKHMEDEHKGSEKFQCEICNKLFKKKGNLIFHKKSHNDKEN